MPEQKLYPKGKIKVNILKKELINTERQKFLKDNISTDFLTAYTDNQGYFCFRLTGIQE